MHVVLLGTAAGGGFPQWNCWCPTCRAVRGGDSGVAVPRTQSSVAVSADGERWFLLNASPDVREQVARLPTTVAPGAMRHVPVEGVVFTDAELDHTLGLALLREGRGLAVWATAPVRRILEEDSRLLPTTRAFAAVETHELALGVGAAEAAAAPLRYRDGAPSGLEVEAFAVAGDPPRFARAVAADEAGHTVGLVVRDAGGAGGVLVYVPGCGALDDAVAEPLAGADLALLDGTFWRDDELIALGVSPSRARDMGHVPIAGNGGSLAHLAALAAPPASRRCVYVHINNTNPVLLEHSPERRAVEAAGVVVGRDGMRFEI